MEFFCPLIPAFRDLRELFANVLHSIMTTSLGCDNPMDAYIAYVKSNTKKQGSNLQAYTCETTPPDSNNSIIYNNDSNRSNNQASEEFILDSGRTCLPKELTTKVEKLKWNRCAHTYKHQTHVHRAPHTPTHTAAHSKSCGPR